MCYDSRARPPYPPIAGGAATGQDIVLTASDGNRFMAYSARSGNASGAQVLIYPDVRGLHQFYKELALRFAEIGIDALAVDYFGRTAGIGARDDSFDYRAYVPRIELPTFFDDVRASIAYLREGGGVNRSIFIVGFCMGGSLTILSAAEDFDVAGGVPFYAGLTRVFPGASGTTLEVATRACVPLLGLFGGADPGIPADSVKQLDEALDKAGMEHEIITYPGAPHSFFDHKYEEFAKESADAWKRILEFIESFKQPKPN
jgi:carboxymethylenebutenolidase